ncbi:hypothetical protein FIBSPDRAFT_549455 [Athelia psychrophila]|uniref:Uncharacterized protein n=1 Tax=Athelia psychrophila TaxID=1759441 RepID=A0A166URU3_9AGAM|nr:hypothetical protein FIBSPDRAFT_549455 [Fibularhizoctonia sp. CBS 109695]
MPHKAWSFRVESGISSSFIPDTDICVKNIALNEPISHSRTRVSLSYHDGNKKMTTILTTLMAGHMEHALVDIYLQRGVLQTFHTNGPNEVFLTGFHTHRMLKHPQKKKAAFRRPKPVISRHCSSLSNALPNSVAVPEKVLEANRGCSIIPYSSESSVSGDEKEITKKPTPTPSKSNGGSILTYLNGNLGDGDCASAGDMVSFFFVVKKIDGTVLDSVAIESDFICSVSASASDHVRDWIFGLVGMKAGGQRRIIVPRAAQSKTRFHDVDLEVSVELRAFLSQFDQETEYMGTRNNSNRPHKRLGHEPDQSNLQHT